jgi:hypothetical protein
MDDEDDREDAPPPQPVRDLQWLASVLDQASRQPSHLRMALSGREALGLGLLQELPDDLPVEERAVAWALEYHVETVDGEGRRRVRLAPTHEYDDGADPPHVEDVPEAVVEVWIALLDLVRVESARARLHHLLFQRGGRYSADHARAAVDSYLKAAEDWDRGLDTVLDLTAATRLARAVDDGELVQESLKRMASLADQHLSGVDPPAGIVLRALRHLVGEPGCPDDVDDLLARAVTAWPEANRRDDVLAVLLERCRDDDARAAVWRRRVAVYTEEAEQASSKLMRAIRLQQALKLAEASGDPGLRRDAASALQDVRHDDLELMAFSATSRRYEEEFEQLVASVSDGEDWREALLRFATYGPLSGDTQRNRSLIEERHRQHPLAAMFPTQLLGPDGLPVYTGTSEEDRFDVDLTQWESDLIRQWIPVMAAALHEIPQRHGLPTLAEISEFLCQWPAVDVPVGLAIARSLLRYWTGDSEGASYTIVPRLETLARTLALQTHRGIYRLQRQHVPGQYAGLGHLLPILQEEHGLDESSVRFLSALLRHPAGLNLRNQMLHGFVGDLGPGVAAVLLHAALGMCTIRPAASTDDGFPVND